MNANLFKAKIAECGLTQGELAKMADMSANSLSRKIHGKRDFKLREIDRLCLILRIDDPYPIFFARIVPNMQQ